MPIHAVLTGDLIKSSRLDAAASGGAMSALADMYSQYVNTHHIPSLGKLDTFRHDSWQLLVQDPGDALHIALFLRAGLKMQSTDEHKLDTRISIGIGAVESIDTERISNSRGEAFTLSGKNLDKMNAEHLTAATSESLSLPAGLIGSTVLLLGAQSDDWTRGDSAAIHGMLLGWTHQETANNWSSLIPGSSTVTRQAVGDHLKRAKWKLVQQVLALFQSEITQAV